MTFEGQKSLFESNQPLTAENMKDTYQKDSYQNLLLTINQVEYSTGADGPVIHIFGRTETGEFKEIQVTEFFPYFYIPASQAGDNYPDRLSK